MQRQGRPVSHSHGRTAMENDDMVRYIVRDTRYSPLSLHDLLLTRANMVNAGSHTKYELACLQYWIMVKQGRLDAPGA